MTWPWGAFLNTFRSRKIFKVRKNHSGIFRLQNSPYFCLRVRMRARASVFKGKVWSESSEGENGE